jgi:lipooligosaccharide transport system permease protein
LTSLRSYLGWPKVSYRTWKVWMRDRDVYMQTYKSNFIPPLLDPILFLLALGFALGKFVQLGGYGGYATFIAPGIIATAVMNVSIFECMFGSFVRMYYQKTFDAIIATPLSVEDVIGGEILWGATKGLIFGAIVYGVILLMQVVLGISIVTSPLSVLVIPLSFVAGLLLSAVGMCFTAKTQQIDGFNFPMFLFVTPMFLFTGTFFPLSALPWQVQDIALALFPLTHVVLITRELMSGALAMDALYSALWIAAVTLLVWTLSINLMKKRLIV